MNVSNGSRKEATDKKVGALNTKSKGCGIMDGNGERLLELCTTYNLVIGGTLFPHPSYTNSPYVPSVGQSIDPQGAL